MKILIIFAHPKMSDSIVQTKMLGAIRNLEGVTIHDIYAAYPDFLIEVDHEQGLLLEHDLVVLQHPFYWYSAPAIIKEWLDLVLEHDWAYGARGTKLHGKFMSGDFHGWARTFLQVTRQEPVRNPGASQPLQSNSLSLWHGLS